MPIITPSGGGGSTAQPFRSETATTSIVTYSVVEIFDVNAAGVVILTMTLTATVPDGETFGPNVGNIGVSLTPESSPDGVVWSVANTLVSTLALDVNGNASTVGNFYEAVYATLQEGRGTAAIVHADGTPYVGPNHPRATVRFDYGVLTLGSTLV